MTKAPVTIFWFRRDLRLHDHRALEAALNSGFPVQCVFIFDTNILHKLENKTDLRLVFIHRQLSLIDQQLRKAGGGLHTFYGTPEDAWKEIIKIYDVKDVFTSTDYEPYATSRDASIADYLEKQGIGFYSVKDQVIFEKDEVVKDDGLPYTVFTPYKKKWLSHFSQAHAAESKLKGFGNKVYKSSPPPIHSLPQIGFNDADFSFTDPRTDTHTLSEYGKRRDIPSVPGTSRISMHLRFGALSIRELVRKALDAQSEPWLNELIWREFYVNILWHFPNVVHSAFKPRYDRIAWRNDPVEFERWCNGTTGYPIVDAGMRELNETGFMHNRVRMIVASFLTKHLLIDWRWGEAHFAEKLLDFELASNNGGWQWAAGCGCDAAPYFRIFNPAEQTKKFDPEFKYIRKWVPEFEDFSYPKPVVDHKMARERCLLTYKKYLLG
jgi:deoxyribodipyrimidine photo-lyase